MSNNEVFDDSAKFSDHFPKIVRRSYSYESFRTLNGIFGILWGVMF